MSPTPTAKLIRKNAAASNQALTSALVPLGVILHTEPEPSSPV